MRPAYYNEFDPHAAAWLRGLIAAGLIGPGWVDTRSITEVKPHELTPFGQCHFFAGIGGWSLALRLAGVPDSEPLWTGSPPCQPFSVAGKGLGFADPRDLWPVFRHLIRQCRPHRVFGEQVAAAITAGWLDRLHTDLEAEDYTCGAVVLGAHSVGADHQRQRLYWVADCQQPGLEGHPGNGHRGNQPRRQPPQQAGSVATGGPAGRLAKPQGGQYDGTIGDGNPAGHGRLADGGRMVHPHGDGCSARGSAATSAGHRHPADPAGFWADSRWIECRDGKRRRVPTQPGLFPLAHGLPYKLARRGSLRPALLRGAGNAIVTQTAAAFITAFYTRES